MRKLTHMFGTAAAATAIALLPIAANSVSAAPPVRNEATVISHVEIDQNDPSAGYVRVRYTCEPSAQPAHLWVSVKQTAEGDADPALLNEGSGFGNIAATWVQSHPTTIQCDGKNQVQVFEVNTLEQAPPEFGGGTIGYGSLIPGQGYVQFCLFTGEGTFVADMQFQKVK